MENTQNKDVKMSVNNLVISFKTSEGKVQAVRDVSFDLYAGETLAVVGESGSGKSVTTKAMLGILAGNAIKEGGEIIYDGMDLMKISEEQFCKIRGDKIAMIFQDPLSSLNPIMRVGKQMTEAMLINGKINRKESRKAFNGTLALLNKHMDAACKGDAAAPQINKRLCYDFNKFECKHLELENAYNDARDSAVEALTDIDDALFLIEKHANNGLAREIKDIVRLSGKAFNDYVVSARADELKAEVANLKALSTVKITDRIGNFVKPMLSRNAKPVDRTDYDKAALSISKIKEILQEAVAFDRPDFFAMGYYVTFAQEPLPDLPVKELNEFLSEYAQNNFIREFMQKAKLGIRDSAETAAKNKREAINVLRAEQSVFEGAVNRRAAAVAVKRMTSAVNDSIDRLQTAKDNVLYTFGSSLKAAVETYFNGIADNIKEEKRYARRKASYDKKVSAGKTPEWKLVDKKLFDTDAARADIVTLIKRVTARLERDVERSDAIDIDGRTEVLIDFLKDKASGVAHRMTRGMAKLRAVKLMEEVGIPEPRKRFRQYPFEFSGGMRQRIVIAIALSADPDVLICDEPTTALDVTIQSQILELINKVKRERNLSVIFITHDLGVVANMADRVAVMYAGKIVEIGTALEVFRAPAHPYTWALLSSMPDLDTKDKLEAIPGTPPNMIYPPKGDAFAERNMYALKIDFERQPPMFKITDTHYAATWLLHPSAPKLDPPRSVLDRIARMKAQTADAEDRAAAEKEIPSTPNGLPHGADEETPPVKKKTAKPRASRTKTAKPDAESDVTRRKSRFDAEKSNAKKNAADTVKQKDKGGADNGK